MWQNIAGNHCIGGQKKIAFSYSDPEGSFGESWITLNPCLAVRRALHFKRGERKWSCIKGQILAACAWCRLSFSMIHVLLILFCLLFIFTVVASTSHFQKALLGLSVFALMAQIIFQIVLGALPPYGHFFPNCKFRLVLVNKFFDCIASVTHWPGRANATTKLDSN